MAKGFLFLTDIGEKCALPQNIYNRKFTGFQLFVVFMPQEKPCMQK